MAVKEIKKSNTDLIETIICLLLGILVGIGTDSFSLGIAAVAASIAFFGFIHDKFKDIMKINEKILKEIEKLNKK